MGTLPMFIPDIGNIKLYNYIYPFFAIGCAAKIDEAGCLKALNSTKIKNCALPVISSLILYIIMMYKYKSKFFIYISGISLLLKQDVLEQIYINTYRFVVGVTGNILLLYLTKRIFNLSKK